MRTMTLLLLLASCAGCFTSAAEGEQLRTTAQTRDQRIAQLEDQSRMSREELDAKVETLEELLERATKLLTRDSADVGAQVDGLREQIATQEGQVAELRHSLEALTAEVAALRAELDKRAPGGQAAMPKAADVPTDKNAHFAAAYQEYEAGKHAEARELFREYLKRYPQNERAGNAQYWIGASYHQQGKPATALGEYRKVISQYQSSTAVNTALYGMADAFYRLGACSDAKTAVRTLLRRKPRQDLESRSKDLMREIKRAPKGHCDS